MLVTSFGLFWRADEIKWFPGKGNRNELKCLVGSEKIDRAFGLRTSADSRVSTFSLINMAPRMSDWRRAIGLGLDCATTTAIILPENGTDFLGSASILSDPRPTAMGFFH